MFLKLASRISPRLLVGFCLVDRDSAAVMLMKDARVATDTPTTDLGYAKCVLNMF